jgi:hypothetical protein
METTTAQQPSIMPAERTKEHEWLDRLVGEWQYETTHALEPGGPELTFRGTETVRSLDGIWIVGEGRGPAPDGSDSTSILTLGFDPVRRRYVGTWIGSMMNYLWVYDGELDESGRVLSLHAAGPDFQSPGKVREYKDVVELVDENTRTLSGWIRGDDGEWAKMMTVTYRRR